MVTSSDSGMISNNIPYVFVEVTTEEDICGIHSMIYEKLGDRNYSIFVNSVLALPLSLEKGKSTTICLNKLGIDKENILRITGYDSKIEVKVLGEWCSTVLNERKIHLKLQPIRSNIENSSRQE